MNESTREIEREKLYPGPGIEPGPLSLRASALPLRYPGHLPIQGRINRFEPSFQTSGPQTLLLLRPIEACIHILDIRISLHYTHFQSSSLSI